MCSPALPMRLLSRSRASSWSSYNFLLSNRRRPMRVDFPSSTEPAVRKRSRSFCSSFFRNSSMDNVPRLSPSIGFPDLLLSSSSMILSENRLEISFTLLLFHACFLVEVDNTGCTFTLGSGHHFLHNLFDCVGFAFHGTCERPAPQRTETYFFHFNLVAVFFRQTVIIRHDELSVDVHHGTFLGKVKWDNGDIFQTDVLPNIQFGPVAEREYPDAFSLADTGVVDVPQFRTLVLRVPLVEFVAERKDTFLGTRFLLVAAGSTEGGIEFVFVKSMKQGLCLHQVGMYLATVGERSYAGTESIHVAFHNQFPAMFGGIFVAELQHLLKLPFRVDVHQRERRTSGCKGLFGQTYHYRRILADAVQHDGILKFCSHLADNIY